MTRREIVKHLPNAITIGRLLSAPVLVWLAHSGMERAFALLLILALLSDVADGWIARAAGVANAFGAMLDTVADIVLMIVILDAIWALHPYVYLDHGWLILSVVLLWFMAHLAALIRYRRLASFHSHLVRAGTGVFGLFASVLFVCGFVPWLLYLAAIVCTLAVLEYFAMLVLMPDWQPDVRGGLLEVLRRRRAGRE